MPLSQAIAELLGRFATGQNIAVLEAAILAGDRARTVAIANEIWASVMPALRERFQSDLTAISAAAYNAAWRRMPGTEPAAPAGAIERAITQGARRVTAMTNQSRGVIRRLVTAAIAGGRSNPRLASVLVASGLGMTRPQAAAHARLSARLADRVADGRMTQERALRRLEASRKKRIRRRARTIARTETSDARGYARQRAWSDAVRTGKIKKDEWEKVWRTSKDDKVDDVCRPLNGATATPTGRFFTGDLRTPKHPNCRCTITLRRKARK